MRRRRRRKRRRRRRRRRRSNGVKADAVKESERDRAAPA